MNLSYTVTSSIEELQQIIHLQQSNLPSSICEEEKEAEGFVTVQHDLEILKKMHDYEPHIIVKDEGKIVGYALSMVSDFKTDIEVLKPMFEKIELLLDGQTSYLVMGQICIDKAYRKQGMFRGLYYKMRDEFMHKYDLLITEVAANNTRSMQAHYAIGFSDLLVYEADGFTWHLIQWNWK
ncbi:GNAT family N-acetyltransferase [Aquimarina celericrescens]|uniref:GNAT family N-acetyltransferase n=1 Tax=Aquimarina celericrescens TaxID=1964542 RepID=A0ABW5AW66_9FLAO|nr:GNAT family N-acetyltransferase [Aquimarina celericrescens]